MDVIRVSAGSLSFGSGLPSPDSGPEAAFLQRSRRNPYDDRERYLSAASVQALAGTSPVAYQSGNYAKAHRRYACIKPFRNVLYPCDLTL